jgi:hypothetical protein
MLRVSCNASMELRRTPWWPATLLFTQMFAAAFLFVTLDYTKPSIMPDTYEYLGLIKPSIRATL